MVAPARRSMVLRGVARGAVPRVRLEAGAGAQGRPGLGWAGAEPSAGQWGLWRWRCICVHRWRGRGLGQGLGAGAIRVDRTGASGRGEGTGHGDWVRTQVIGVLVGIGARRPDGDRGFGTGGCTKEHTASLCMRGRVSHASDQPKASGCRVVRARALGRRRHGDFGVWRGQGLRSRRMHQG